ncbi:MAG TPA: hypothetical protein VI278_16560 [Nitrososphaeraceae archaeon]|jgi:hypothetical protein
MSKKVKSSGIKRLLGKSKVIIAGVNTAVYTCFPAILARNAGYSAYAAIDASGWIIVTAIRL